VVALTLLISSPRQKRCKSFAVLPLTPKMPITSSAPSYIGGEEGLRGGKNQGQTQEGRWNDNIIVYLSISILSLILPSFIPSPFCQQHQRGAGVVGGTTRVGRYFLAISVPNASPSSRSPRQTYFAPARQVPGRHPPPHRRPPWPPVTRGAPRWTVPTTLAARDARGPNVAAWGPPGRRKIRPFLNIRRPNP